MHGYSPRPAPDSTLLDLNPEALHWIHYRLSGDMSIASSERVEMDVNSLSRTAPCTRRIHKIQDPSILPAATLQARQDGRDRPLVV
jgi:hypothetical protein